MLQRVKSENRALPIDLYCKITVFGLESPYKHTEKFELLSLGTLATMMVPKAINVLILNSYLLDLLYEGGAGKCVCGTDTL